MSQKWMAIFLLMANVLLHGQIGRIELEAKSFEFKTGSVEFTNHKGRNCMKLAANSGQVVVKALDFEKGIIEFDVESILPGFAQSVYFHRKDEKEQEIVYLRVTKMGDKLANEAVQYTPYFDGVNMWDMYPQYQAPAEIKKEDWNHMKLVINGKRMRVFVNNDKIPVLEIPKLEGNYSKGSIAFEGQGYISNLSINPGITENLSPEILPDITDHRSNYIRNWAINMPNLLEKGREVTVENLPADTAFNQSIHAEREGLINLTRKFGMNPLRKVIWLNASIECKNDQSNFLDLGFSDEVWVFLNDKMVWVDKNLYQQDMQKYPKGRISIENTRIPLRLKAGQNKLTIAVANDFYGWGIIARLLSTDGVISIEALGPKPEIPMKDSKVYIGEYSSKSYQGIATFTVEKNKLFYEAANQEAIEFAYVGNQSFESKNGNSKMLFYPNEKKFLLRQGDQTLEFYKIHGD